ncbi:OmpP1/FadL family transporter [Caulobacter segnis]
MIAYRVNDLIDLGVGVSALYADAELTNALPNISPLQPDGCPQSLKGDGWAYGYTVGAQLHPSKSLTIGASYRSKIDQKLDGTVKGRGACWPRSRPPTTSPSMARPRSPCPGSPMSAPAGR